MSVETRPRLLDLYCCEGGAAMGYHRAGFDVIGVGYRPAAPVVVDPARHPITEYGTTRCRTNGGIAAEIDELTGECWSCGAVVVDPGEAAVTDEMVEAAAQYISGLNDTLWASNVAYTSALVREYRNTARAALVAALAVSRTTPTEQETR